MQIQPDQFNALFLRLLDGQLSSEEFQALDQCFSDHPEAIHDFIEFCLTQEALEEQFHFDPSWQDLQHETRSHEPAPKEKRLHGTLPSTRRRWLAGLCTVAALVIVLLAIRGAWRTPLPPTRNAPFTGPAVATITQTSGAVWEHAQHMPVNTPLIPGTLHLLEGFAEITFGGIPLVICGGGGGKVHSGKDLLSKHHFVLVTVKEDGITREMVLME